MNLHEIAEAVDAGKTVHWQNPGYVIIRDRVNQFLYIHCPSTHSLSPLVYNGKLAGNEGEFFLAEPQARRAWLLDLRATCLVDAVDEAGARKAWEDGLEYEYEIDTEGGILCIEPYEDRDPRPEGSPGETPFSFTKGELEQLLYCLEQASIDYSERDPREASEDQRDYDSAMRKLLGSTPSAPDDPLAGEGEMNDFSSSMLGN
jgi:hypothetical protein